MAGSRRHGDGWRHAAVLIMKGRRAKGQQDRSAEAPERRSAEVLKRGAARFALLGLLFLTACGSEDPSRSATGAPAQGKAQPASASAFPRTVVDGAGRSITLPSPPRRIVSQTLATDEVLFSIVDPARIVGVSTLARDPAYSNVVKQATALGAPAITSAEQVLTLRPDLVFVATFSRSEIVAVLAQSGAPVYRFGAFDRLDDVKANIRRLGEAVGADAEAARLTATMDQRLAAVAARRARASGPAPRILSWGPSGFTAGAGTTFDDIVRAAGAVNIVAAEGIKGFPRISAEQVLAWQPDFIVVGINRGEREAVERALKENPAIAATRAMRAGRLIFLENHSLLAISHYVVDAVEALAAALETPVSPQPGDAAGDAQ
jgi:iron complex transport system substrate-binding protein